ncbi:sugar phosphate isomerase/epimerase [Burkholderia glumae]|uniref:sugar phosphate isomerase/epimerase family protein n=1 Tax=Burkholderia glumae TaxID=337 RepID=UPI000C27E874|nr:sugar phosphate isomerase/epimerase [Burkholderia glumae]MCQ0032292.1 sugar phosphate isomerase/epimerase [Burkholderia glumae]MCQ0037086.1 sugar phosphate isomerase/epimerase [Burkholderia glumae]PJO22910.1 hypothetical protein Y5A_011760 [Burkholderia glumae AU6208]QHE13464.1 TIM barrel protein [Burkholderia glumae AU6208]QJW81840.1 sugar phosphate isomerase/epimerase [Burkholderia glumae]
MAARGRACRVCGMLYAAFQTHGVPTTAAGVAMPVPILGRAAETAARDGILLGLEAVKRYESKVPNPASRGIELCERIGRPHSKAHLHTYHINIEESDVMTAIRETGAHLNYFHCGDFHRGSLGSGRIDLAAIVPALAVSGYAGPIACESCSSRGGGQPLGGGLAIRRERRQDARALASHARRDTRARLESVLESAPEALRQAERGRLS